MGQAAVKIEPKFEDISIREIAKRCKIDRTVCASRLEDLGYEPVHEEAKLKLYRFDDEMAFALKSAKDSLSAAKIRDLRATYELKELKLAEARRDLIPVQEVTELSQKLHSLIHKELKVNQPNRLSTRLARAKTATEVKKILTLEADKFLKRLLDEDQW